MTSFLIRMRNTREATIDIATAVSGTVLYSAMICLILRYILWVSFCFVG